MNSWALNNGPLPEWSPWTIPSHDPSQTEMLPSLPQGLNSWWWTLQGLLHALSLSLSLSLSHIKYINRRQCRVQTFCFWSSLASRMSASFQKGALSHGKGWEGPIWHEALHGVWGLCGPPLVWCHADVTVSSSSHSSIFFFLNWSSKFHRCNSYHKKY